METPNMAMQGKPMEQPFHIKKKKKNCNEGLTISKSLRRIEVFTNTSYRRSIQEWGGVVGGASRRKW